MKIELFQYFYITGYVTSIPNYWPSHFGFPGRAAWAEIAGQNGLADLATNLDYHLVGYRHHISCDIEKLEQFYFRLTGPSIRCYHTLKI